jgi:hypothetical protein
MSFFSLLITNKILKKFFDNILFYNPSPFSFSTGLSLETIADVVAKEGYSSLSRGLSETLDIRDVCIVANDCMVLAGSPLF